MKHPFGEEYRRVVADPPLAELLWEWLSVIERSVRLWPDDDDAAWMYNERAAVSILAGAVWRLGGIAFEEYAAEKRVHSRTRMGRTDIYFQIAEQEYVGEAKNLYCVLR